MSTEIETTQAEQPAEIVTETAAPVIEDKPYNDELRDTIAKEIDKLEQPQDEPEPEQPEATEQVEVEPKDFQKLGYTKDESSILETLSEEAKAIVEARELRAQKGIEKLKGQADIAKSFTQALAPHSEYLSALQVTPQDFIPALVQTEMTLRLGNPQQKAAIIQQLAHDYGIDLGEVAQQQFDPNLYSLQKQRDQLTRQLQQQNQAVQAAEQDKMLNQVLEWANNKPYFEDVREDMALLIETGKAKDLDEAYTKAIRLNDEVYKKTQLQVNNQAAKFAKKSAVQVTGAPSGASSLPKLETAQDRARYALAKHGY